MIDYTYRIDVDFADAVKAIEVEKIDTRSRRDILYIRPFI